jgi:hypothetical protein
MKKNFVHHKHWFHILKYKMPNWTGDTHCLNCSDDRHPIDQFKGSTFHFYHYVEEDDTLWKISNEDTVKHRIWYNGRWHITRDYLTQIPITEEWREHINAYEYVERR